MSVWEGLRLVALDLECCLTDAGWRIVSVGMVSRRAEAASGSFEQWINPGVPIDAESAKVHHITDALVAREPSFPAVTRDILRRLEPAAGERVVLVAHNASYDIPILRAEFLRTPDVLPDLPVLDTMVGLRRAAGFGDGPAALLDMMAAVGLEPLTRKEHHGALADARACADLAAALIERVAAPDLAALLERTGGLRVTTVEDREFRPRAPRAQVVPLPACHAALHNDLPPDLVSLIAACATLRCERLVELAEHLPPDAIRPLLFAQLAACGDTGDRAGGATVLGALIPLLAGIPAGIKALRTEIPGISSHTTGQNPARHSAMAVAAWIEQTTAGHCERPDFCPACADGMPCAADSFTDALVEPCVTRTPDGMDNFWRTDRPKLTGGRQYRVIALASQALADGALSEVLRHYDAADPAHSGAIVDSMWSEGIRSPVIADRKVAQTVAAGRVADLVAARALCDEALATRHGSTGQPWASLAVRRAQIEAAIERRTDTGVRKHSPTDPRRPPRPTRFLRQLPG